MSLFEFGYNEIKIYKGIPYVFKKTKHVKESEITDYMCGIKPNHETIETGE